MTRLRNWVGFLGCLTMLAACPAVAAPEPQAPAPARPDTARLGFTAVDSLPAPIALHVLADSVAFGGLLPVAWDLPAGTVVKDAALPAPAGDQFAAEKKDNGPWWRRSVRSGAQIDALAPLLAALPAAPGPRVVAWYRIYRTDPFRLEWAGVVSEPVSVSGRVDDPSRMAAIRDPRPWGWFTRGMAAVLAAAALTALLAWWWWRRRHRGVEPVDWPLPEPAWIGAAFALAELAGERRLERGEPKSFLDGLAAAARRFAAAHFGVPAAELTGAELVIACVARGFDPALPTALARLIEAADLRRYDPEPPSPAWCRGQAAELLERVDAARVKPRQTAVAAERLLAAGKAWTTAVDAMTIGSSERARATGREGR